MTSKERIIVIRTIKHGDSNLIVHGINSQGARMNFFARGAAKSRKRFGGGVLEPTHFLEVTYKVNSSPDDDPLHSLLEAGIIREFPKLREKYERLEVALYLLRLVSKVSQQGVVDASELFNLLGNALAAAESSNQPSLLRLHFEIKILQTQGVLDSSPEMLDWLKRPISDHAALAMSTQVNRQVHEQIQSYIGIV